MDFKFRYQISLLIIIALLSAQCGKDCSKLAKFEIPIKIYPVYEVYHVGDTIWIEFILQQLIQDEITGNEFNVGYYDFEIGTNVIQILDSSVANATTKVEAFADIGELRIMGITYPDVVPKSVIEQSNGIQHWRFGLIPKVSSVNLVLLFTKRNPPGWQGEYKFPEDDCIYGISSSVFLTNEGNINYEYYVEKFPYFKESGNGPNIAENHRNTGAFFISVE